MKKVRKLYVSHMYYIRITYVSYVCVIYVLYMYLGEARRRRGGGAGGGGGEATAARIKTSYAYIECIPRVHASSTCRIHT